jgi:hypothetical protein
VVDAVVVHVVTVVLVATLLRSALGFGEALVAVPLLALRIPIPVARRLRIDPAVVGGALSRHPPHGW